MPLHLQQSSRDAYHSYNDQHTTHARGLQVTRVEVALANGTLASVTPASHPHLWRALQAREPAPLTVRLCTPAQSHERWNP
jgi:hypothetical protein